MSLTKVPITLVYKKKYSASEKKKLNGIDATWKGQTQRSPRITNDIILLHKYKQPGDKKPEWNVLAGWWEKEVSIGGKKQKLAGITFVPGGHMEAMGVRDKKISGGEEGDVNLNTSAKKELWEETGIRGSDISRMQPLALIDMAENDPRAHVIRMIWIATTKKMPKPTEEISAFYHIPLKKLPGLLKGNKGKFVLNHDKMMKIVMSLPEFKKYVKSLK